jgi:hypothetical protein
MNVTLDLPPHVERAYIAEAEAKGIPLDNLLSEVLIARQPDLASAEAIFERGLGLFGSPEDAALLDEVVSIAYEERRHPTKPSAAL